MPEESNAPIKKRRTFSVVCYHRRSSRNCPLTFAVVAYLDTSSRAEFLEAREFIELAAEKLRDGMRADGHSAAIAWSTKEDPDLAEQKLAASMPRAAAGRRPRR